MVRPVGSWVLESNNVVAEGLAASLDKPLEWAVGGGGVRGQAAASQKRDGAPVRCAHVISPLKTYGQGVRLSPTKFQ